MTETKPGPLAGYRPAASPRNGMPLGGGYRRFGNPDWDPANGVHLDPEAVAAGIASPNRWPGGKAARLAVYAKARDAGLTREQAAARVGIAPDTSVKYERAYRRGEIS